jgi:CRISPR-associated protein Cas6
MAVIELAFPVAGAILPEDNGYGVYAAVSRALGNHLPEDVAVDSIGGPLLGRWRVQVTRETRLRLRAPADRIGDLLPLAGQFLDVDGHEVGLGVPEVRALMPAPELVARVVSIKGFTEPGPFLGAARRQLDALGVSGTPTIPVVPGGMRKGWPQRRVVRVKGRAIVGFALHVGDLSPPDSLTLLTRGLGGRRHMGCGIFVPARGPGGTTHGV